MCRWIVVVFVFGVAAVAGGLIRAVWPQDGLGRVAPAAAVAPARAWPAPRRVAHGSDVTTPATLTVSAVPNQAKGAAPPDAWQPPDAAARCRYAAGWGTVKSTWQLTVTATGRDVSVLDRGGAGREVAR